MCSTVAHASDSPPQVEEPRSGCSQAVPAPPSLTVTWQSAKSSPLKSLENPTSATPEFVSFENPAAETDSVHTARDNNTWEDDTTDSAPEFETCEQVLSIFDDAEEVEVDEREAEGARGKREGFREEVVGDEHTAHGSDVASEYSEGNLVEVEYVMHPAFPNLPSSVPLTYTLAMHACLSAVPTERPTFAQVRSNAP